ncbi:MAG: DUF1385 domain-containing protein [Clostridiaceae bacterium]|nr:DUF1385 domain-containing protein [Clostridiaceae bacterium]
MKNKTDNQKQCKKTSIGGQALIEGLIMLGPEKKAMATRSADGSIKVSVTERAPAKGIAKVPFIRGPVRLVSQMAVGITALMRSAELAEFESETNSPDVSESGDTLTEDAGQQNVEAVLPAEGAGLKSNDTVSLSEAAALQSDKASDLSGSADGPEPAGKFEPATQAPSTNRSEADEIIDGSAGKTEEFDKIEAVNETEAHGEAEMPDKAEAAGKTEETYKPEKPEKPSRLDAWLERHSTLVLWGMVFVALGFSVVLFILLPSLLTDGIRALIVWQGGTVSQSNFFLSLVEGIIRITIFVSYLWLASRMGDVKRVWMYHGSEHKTIAAYEAGEELTVENVRKYSRFHPRCGTAFMFLVMVVSILVFALVGRHGPLINLLLRLLLLPLVAAISYELIHLAGRYDNPVTRFVSLPGLAMQRFTTAEPDDSMLEVAIAAIKPVIPADPDSDKW